MIDWDNPAEVLEHQRNLEWYIVTITGINAEGNPGSADVQMSGDIEATVEIWARHKSWSNVEILNKQYIGKVPEQKH